MATQGLRQLADARPTARAGRELANSPLDDAARAEAEGLIVEFKRLVGVVDSGWRSSPPRRRR
jgi:hypothetical protein